VTVLGLQGVTAISTQVRHSCAVVAGGSVSCWGQNDTGQLGIDTMGERQLSPVAVLGLTNVVSLDTGSFGTCAADAAGIARCWGYNGEGELGDGTNTNSSVPVQVIGIP
jgi:alpha-tubulin suppressor-like RCC1 family protein